MKRLSSIFITIFSLTLFFSAVHTAHADTYVYSSTGGSIISTVSIDKPSYTPSSAIQVSTSVSSTYTITKEVSLTAVTSGNSLVTPIPDQNISAGGTIIGSPSPVSFTSSSASGSYSVDFVTGIALASAWGYVPYSLPYSVAVNPLPVVNAGSDQVLTLPTSTASLSGSASDPNGSVSSVAWTFVSGPLTPTITSPSTLSTNITGMSSAGTYIFRLSATDNQGGVGSDTMQVTVSAANAPDLIASTTTPLTAVEGEVNIFSANIANQGATSSGGTSTTLFQFDSNLDHTSVDGAVTTTVSAIAAGGTTTASASYTFPSAGTWYVRACADNNASFVGTIAEVNESNNCSSSWRAVNVRPQGDPFMQLVANPYGVVQGGSSTLSITANNFATSVTCTIDQGVGAVTMTSAGTSSWTGSVLVTNLTETTTYTAMCVGPSGSDNGGAIVYVDEGNIPGAVLVADPQTIAPGESSNLTWWSTNTTTCTGVNFSTGGATSGSISINPSSTTTYNVVCTGPNGSADSPETVTVSTEGGGGGGSGDTQCSDGIDNDDTEDELADDEDPGCHSDGDVTNEESYDPNDDQESNRRRPIFIDY